MPNLSRTRFLRAASSALALLSLCLLAGCGSASNGSGATATPSGAEGGKTLVVAIPDDVKSLDPALAFDTWSTMIVHACTRRLVDYDDAGKLVPDLAERWEVSDDGKNYTFHLRDAKFADGTAIASKHFRAALHRVQDPKTGSPGAGFYRGIVSVETPDPKTLAIELDKPDPTLLNLVGLTFLAPELPGADKGKPSPSGPYQVESVSGSEVVLKRNPHDNRNPSRLGGIRVQLKVNDALRTTRFRTGEVDLLPGIPPADYPRVMANAAEKRGVVQGPVNQTWYFGMKVDRAPWSNPVVRQAALLAIDRTKHARLSGPGEPANGILPPHLPGADAARTLPGQNVAEAKRLLAEAGFANGVPGRTALWINTTADYLRHAQAIQSDLAAVGIQVDLKPVSNTQYLSGYRREADCWYGGWYPDFPDAGNFLEPLFLGGEKAASNATHYNNPVVNRLLTQARTTPLGPERNVLYKQAEDQLLKDLPWVPLYFEVETRWFKEGVTGVKVHPVWRQMLTGIDKR